MTAVRCPIALLTASILAGTCGIAAAQSASETRGYVAVKAGLNHEEAEDGLSGTTGAGGVAGGLRLGRAWTAEIELWVPAAIRDAAGEPQHRDIPFSVAVIRSFDLRRSRPYLVAGLSIARTHDYLTSCIADRVPPLGTAQPVPAIVDCSEPDVRERVRERFTHSSGYLLAGAGIEVPLGRRVRLAPEVRMHVSPVSVIVRPAIGLVVVF